MAEEAVRMEAVEAIDSLLAFLDKSGLVEEGGGLALYERIKPLADVRARLAENGMASDGSIPEAAVASAYAGEAVSDPERVRRLNEASGADDLRKKLQAAYPAILSDLRSRLSEAGKALDDPQLLNGFAGIVNHVLDTLEGEG